MKWINAADKYGTCNLNFLSLSLLGMRHIGVAESYQSYMYPTHLLSSLDVIQGAFLGQLVDGVCTLLQSKAREVLSPTLGLVKVLVTILEDVTLAQYVQQLVSARL